jgi:hypothetical protein
MASSHIEARPSASRATSGSIPYILTKVSKPAVKVGVSQLSGQRAINRKHEPRRLVRTRRAIGLAILLGGLGLTSASASSATGHRGAARAAHVLNGTATAHLHLIRPEGTKLYEEGPVTGALAGSMRAEFDTGTTFTGSFTIRTHGGSIDGSGSASPHGTGRYRSFSGALTITGGTGRYSHAHGRAGLYGTFDRRSYALLIQTTGTLSY